MIERRRKMRIIFVLPGYPDKPIGGFMVVYEYANHLAARGHEVTVAHVRKFTNWEPPVPNNIFAGLRRKAAYLRDMILTPKIKWQDLDPRVNMLFIPKFKEDALPDADILFATGWQTVEDVLKCSLKKGGKYYLIQHYETWCGAKEHVDATWGAPLKKIVISDWLFKLGMELGVPADEMVHVPNGINHSVFQILNAVENRSQKIAMLYGPAWKGGKDGVEALQITKEKFPSIQAVLFGWSSRPEWLPHWMEYIQTPDKRVLIDYIYNKSSIFLCPSWSEGWGLPAAEAMACGCAVVSTDNGGVRDYATQNETALLSSPKNPDDLAANIAKLLIDDGLRKQLANKGHERIKEFDWKHSTDILENYLLKNL